MDERRCGGCQCRSLRYEFEGHPVAVTVCHCADCQQQSGSAFSMSMLVPKKAFRWLAGEPARFHTQADSGADKLCVFCRDCGTRIYNELSSMPATFNLKPGTLDDTSGFEPALQVWTSNKQPWLELPGRIRAFEKNPG